ncbi:hypothetical protein V1477_014941 [Vespula maculifrons]
MNEDYVDAEAGVIKSQKQPLLLTPWTNLSSVGYAFRCVVGPRRSSPHTTDNEPFGNQKYSLGKFSFAFILPYTAHQNFGQVSIQPKKDKFPKTKEDPDLKSVYPQSLHENKSLTSKRHSLEWLPVVGGNGM